MASENHNYTKNGNLKRAPYEEVARWVSEAWKEVSTETIKSGFSHAEIISNIPIDENNNVTSDDELDEELLQLLNSDTEGSEFEGFD